MVEPDENAKTYLGVSLIMDSKTQQQESLVKKGKMSKWDIQKVVQRKIVSLLFPKFDAAGPSSQSKARALQEWLAKERNARKNSTNACQLLDAPQWELLDSPLQFHLRSLLHHVSNFHKNFLINVYRYKMLVQILVVEKDDSLSITCLKGYKYEDFEVDNVASLRGN